MRKFAVLVTSANGEESMIGVWLTRPEALEVQTEAEYIYGIPARVWDIILVVHATGHA